MSPLEAFVTAIKFFWSPKKCAWLLHWSLLRHLIAWFSRFKSQIAAVRSRSIDLAVWRSPWSLDPHPKQALITWYNIDPGRKCFYMGHISDYRSWWVVMEECNYQSVLLDLIGHSRFLPWQKLDGCSVTRPSLQRVWLEKCVRHTLA